jgi:hypothetical protein
MHASPAAPRGRSGSVKQLEQRLFGVLMRKVAAETRAAALDKEVTVQTSPLDSFWMLEQMRAHWTVASRMR